MPWLALGYPLLAHLGVWLHSPLLQWLALVWLAIAVLGSALRRVRIWAWTSFIAWSAVSYWLSMRGDGWYALLLPPIAIPAALFALFAQSLRAGDTPLVTRLAERVRGESLPPELIVYTRRVTVLWCAVSATLTLSAIITALWTPPVVWSWTVNVVHYVVLGAMFAGEFAYRRLHYARYEPWSFFEFIQRLSRTRWV